MGADIEVVTADLRASAQALGPAAEGARDASPDVAVAGIAEALPSSESAVAAASLETVWGARFRSWSEAVEDQKQRLVDSARDYDGSDRLSEAVISALGGAGPR
jgi:hypothetical protein